MRAVVLFIVACCVTISYAGSALPNTWATCSGDDSVKTSTTRIEGDVSTDPHVTKRGSGGVFYIMRDGDDEDYQFILTSEQKLYSTDDGGDFWYLENDRMPGADDSGFPYLSRQGIYKFFSSHDGKRFVALSFKEGFWTKEFNSGWTWVPTPGLIWKDLKPHPSKSGFAATAQTKACYSDQEVGVCLTQLYWSPDWGRTTTDIIYSSVLQFDWSTLNDNFIFFTGYADPSVRGGSYYETKLWRHDITQGVTSRKLLHEHQAGLVYNAKSRILMFATNEARDGSKRRLFASHDDGEHITECKFPEFLAEEKSYNIMDVDTGSVFVMLRRQGDFDRGDVYVSSDISREFKLSITENVAQGLRGDLQEVEAMEGTYIANVYEPPDDSVVTYITFDNGGYWSPISPPAGSPQCRGEAQCYMNLLGRSQKSIGSAPYSTANAVGLIISSGNVGPSLTADAGEIDTYMTRDGGIAWELLSSGDNYFDIADRGAIILIAGRGRADVDKFRWSFNEGTSWIPCTWTGEREVHGVFTSPTRDGSRFLVFSEVDGHKHVTKVDFANLAAIQCRDPEHPGTAGSDYEYFNVAVDQGCILGHKTTYIRKKRAVKCFNSENSINHQVENCACDREDYECAPCFTEDFWENWGSCVPVPGCTPVPKCSDGAATYFDGEYRKLAGDTCTISGENSWEPKEKSCVGVPTAPPTQITDGNNPTARPLVPTAAPSTSTSTGTTPAPSDKGPLIIALVVVALVVIVVIAAVLMRRSAAMAARFPNAPSWMFTNRQVSGFESSFTTPGELEEPSEFEQQDFDF